AATISDSFATGNVTATANLPACSTNCDFVVAGGLVGQNFGTVIATNVPTLLTPCAAGATCAIGDVSVGSRGIAGGLIGENEGIVTNTFERGNVTGVAGPGNSLNEVDVTVLGGLVGINDGLITSSFATGTVGALNVNALVAGGLVGDNSGAIFDSFAIG